MQGRGARATERRQFERFRELSGLLPDGIYTDTPDFLVQKDGRSIGVELTTVYASVESFSTHGLPDPTAARAGARADHERWSHTMRIAEDRSADALPAGTNVWVYRRQQLHPHRLEALANQLIAIVARHPPGTMPLCLPGWADGGRELPAEVDELMISGGGSNAKPRWHLTEMSLVYPVGAPYMQDCIARKSSEQIDAYRRRCDELWLILAAEGRSTATHLTLSEEAKHATYVTNADRVFFVNEAAGSCLELQRRPTGAAGECLPRGGVR